MSNKKNIKPIIEQDKIQVNRIMDYNILWFGVDKYGYIFCARTEFTRHVPEFVVRNIEKNEFVKKFFTEFLGTVFIDEDINNLASKGIFYYDLIDDYFVEYDDKKRIEESKNEFKKHPYHYKKMTKSNPTNPLHFDQLPKNIQEILDSQRVKIDAHNTKYFFIPEIYKDSSGNINKEAFDNKFTYKPMLER